MKSIGFMTIRENQEEAYFTEIASCAPASTKVVRFTPLDIDPLTEQINGFRFVVEEQNWEKATFPIPDYIYDRCFYNQHPFSKKSEPIVKWLKRRPGTTFLGYGLPDKWEVYKALCEDSLVSAYIPQTEYVTNFSKLSKLLKKEKSIVLKPLSGSGGNGVIHLQLSNSGITYQTQFKGVKVKQIFTSSSEFKNFIEKLLHKTPLLAQKFLHLQKDNRPFDIRVLMQKDEHGKWIEQGRGVRVGEENGFVSNLQNGGLVIPFEQLTAEWDPRNRTLILEEIETILTQVPGLLEEKFGRLFELAIDIGVTEKGAVWILDLNSKPGRKVILTTSSNVQQKLFKSVIEYMNFLESQQTAAF